MNIIHHRSAWGIAIASAALALTTACGSEVATDAPGSIGGAANEQSSPAPTNDRCYGSPDSADFAERCGYAGSQDNQGGSVRPGRLPDAWS
jgi:hypothetical protein